MRQVATGNSSCVVFSLNLMRKKGKPYSHDSHYVMRLVSLSLEIDYRHHKFLSTITTIAKVKHCALVFNKIIQSRKWRLSYLCRSAFKRKLYIGEMKRDSWNSFNGDSRHVCDFYFPLTVFSISINFFQFLRRFELSFIITNRSLQDGGY